MTRMLSPAFSRISAAMPLEMVSQPPPATPPAHVSDSWPTADVAERPSRIAVNPSSEARLISPGLPPALTLPCAADEETHDNADTASDRAGALLRDGAAAGGGRAPRDGLHLEPGPRDPRGRRRHASAPHPQRAVAQRAEHLQPDRPPGDRPGPALRP